MPVDGLLVPGSERLRGIFARGTVPSEAHAGLVFDRYLPLWEPGEGVPSRLPLRDPLMGFAAGFNNRAGDVLPARRLEQMHSRLDRARPSDRVRPDGLYARVDYHTAERLATGLGTDHPTENGFAFDAVLGVPVLAGAGVKGLCRVAANELTDIDEATIEMLLGPADLEQRPEEAACGDLMFLDAYPAHWPRLGVDVVNCHYPDYYRALQRERHDLEPLESERPVPVFFLTVERGVVFVFRLGSRSGQRTHLDQGLNLLDSGLSLLGFGAKTAVGYGLMERDNEPTNGETKPLVESPWLDNKLAELAAASHSSLNETLRSRRLAEAWAALPDSKEKRSAWVAIQRRWQAQGWWGAPTGRSMRAAFVIYDRFQDSRAP